MASVSLTTSAGISSIATPTKARSTSLVTQAGLYSAPRELAWAGTTAALDRVPWIPRAGTPLSLDGGRTLNPVWDRCLRWLFEEAIGGIRAPTPKQLREEVEATQAQVATTTNFVEQAVAYTAGVATTVAAVREVAQSNSLSGASSIPEPPAAPTYSDPV